MQGAFSPDFHHILSAALHGGGYRDKVEYFTRYCAFFRDTGYDTVTFEACVTEVVQRGECLSGHVPGIIRNRADFKAFDFPAVEREFWKMFYDDFRALREGMPAGMKGIGGIGNGVFEIVQDFTGFAALCMLRVDDPPLYADLFQAAGDLMLSIWRKFLAEFADLFAVCRFGDDLGFKSSTLLVPEDIRKLVIPQYRRIVDLVHASGTPFLLHCCGNIFDVMNDIVTGACIVDMNALCTLPEAEIKRYTLDVVVRSSAQAGFAVGSGNSIPDYVPANGYLAMVNAVREYRGDYQ